MSCIFMQSERCMTTDSNTELLKLKMQNNS